MKTVFIRDDDVSFFTSPEQLETIYSRLWSSGIPVSFAVIPHHRANTRVLHREGHPYDPGIAKVYRGQDKAFLLADNPELCAFLNEKARMGLVEICLHGFEHSYYEFASEDTGSLREKIKTGLAELQAALPDVNITTFIAPYDRISTPAFDLLVEHSFNICTGTYSLQSTPYHDMTSYSHRVMADGRNVFACDEYFFTHHATPEACFELAMRRLQEADPLIVVNHYWTFFYDWSGNWVDMQAVWNRYVDQLLALKNTQFLTFGGV